MMKIMLPIGGKDLTYTENELAAILKKHLDAKKLASLPREGLPFVVDIKTIRAREYLFSTPRADKEQEKIRGLILEALSMAAYYPEKYGRAFWTLMPEKTWVYKDIAELKYLAKTLGGEMSDWVEWVLQLAQRICNGESWDSLCNEPDTAQWFIAVTWRDNKTHLVGGALKDSKPLTASTILEFDAECPAAAMLLNYTVPLITITNF